jgi:type IV pilus assembly protein PilN
VKPIHLNLASRPYRDYRPVYAVVVVLSILTAYLLLENVDTYYRYIDSTRNTRSDIARIERQTDSERQRADMTERRLKTLNLKLLDDQTRFINAKLRERSFSWSILLDELETVLPRDVRVLSIAPTVAPTGAVTLSLAFESKSAEGMITILDNLHRDPQFGNPFPSAETNNGGIYSFGITTTFYPPGVANPYASGEARNVNAPAAVKGNQP